ncbi:unnamed protein product [Symbiodinium natans]|uniref:Phytanoyl-CoA dioxygenase family protein n=1 Tax=Symbiodinium natans TaxID=878477 RepID=A0A812U1P8_9DINO|nr:unnamed protein product [Symbiodinium natans]
MPWFGMLGQQASSQSLVRWRRLSPPLVLRPRRGAHMAQTSAATRRCLADPRRPCLGANWRCGGLGCHFFEDGAILLSDAVPLEAVDALRHQLKIGPAPRPVREVPTREVLALTASTTPPQEPSTGRRHFLLRGTVLAEESLVPLLAPLMPLVLRFFEEFRPDAAPGRLLQGAIGAEERPPRLFLSECQLLISDPGAVPQMWHRDNLMPGLTIVLPVSEVTSELGPTELLPGTQHLLRGAGGLGSCFRSLGRAGGALAPAPLRPGEALLFDARLLHRGLGNRSYSNCRVVVVMRLDMLDTTPPGATVAQTTVARIFGKLLQGLSYAYGFLPVPAAATTFDK